MKRKYIFLASLIIIVVLASCKSTLNHAISGSGKKNKSVLSNQERLENGAMFIDACREKTMGNYTEAGNLLLKILQNDNKNDAAIYELGGLYELQNDNDKALKLAKEAVRLDPGNKWYKVFLADMYQKNKYYEESANIYKELAVRYNDPDYYFNCGVALVYAGKYYDAIRLYDEMEKKFGLSEEIITQKQKLYLHLNKVDKAVAEVEKLLKESPAETKYYLLIAELLMNNNMFDKALPYYKKVSEINPDDPYIHISLADYYRKQGNKEKSFEELKAGFASPNLDIDTKINILLSYFTISEFYNEMKPQAYELLNILVKTHPENPKAFSMMGDYLYRDKKLNEAKEAFNKVISLDSSKYVVWETLLFIHSEQNDNIALRDDSKRAMELFPVQPTPFLFNGMANYMFKDYTEAIKSLKAGLELAGDNKDLASQFYMYLGDTYYQLNKPDTAFAFYDKVLAIDPNNTYVLNNYSYYLSLLSEKLEKALEMAKKANILEPENNSFQDTYGWVFYKLGKCEDAKKWIGKAIDNGAGNKGEVLEHYGDVLFKLGDVTNSVIYWEKALKAGGATPNIDKKIRDKKLYE